MKLMIIVLKKKG